MQTKLINMHKKHFGPPQTAARRGTRVATGRVRSEGSPAPGHPGGGRALQPTQPTDRAA